MMMLSDAGGSVDNANALAAPSCESTIEALKHYNLQKHTNNN
jgi:hypothetical protein